LPQSYATGVLYLIAYAVGLSLSLLLIGYLGQRVVKKLRGAADPKGWFKRGLGALFILVGLFIMTGTDKKLQTYILDTGFLDITKVEQALLTEPMADTMDTSTNNISGSGTIKNYPRYKEIAKPAGFVNSDPFQLADLVGKKVILLDIMTYSCINCQRTFPYVNSWYEKYKDAGLAIVGIHTPEFAFEHKKENVEEAAKQFGLTFPLVLDNEYATWNAYGNRYWPRKYLIDIDGNIVYDHIGEGGYEETEKKIQELLRERRERLGETTTIASDIARPEDAETPDTRTKRSPETYVGFLRNQNPGIVASEQNGHITFSRPSNPSPDRLYLVGTWDVTGEYAEAVSDDASILYTYTAKNVFLVMSAETNVTATLLRDGALLTSDLGTHAEKNGTVRVQNEQLYRLIEQTSSESHTLEIKAEPGLRAFAFTFG
jgi:thiol-disulfide isomerase/thioredoxin